MSWTFNDYDRAVTKVAAGFKQRGPAFGNGPGPPWNGVVEETPQFWINWIVDHARRRGHSIPKAIEVDQTHVPIEAVALSYGKRAYFRCPWCHRRTEVLYFLPRQFGCRKCCGLGYRSQKNRRGSIWGLFDRVFARRDYDRTWAEQAAVNNLVVGLREHLMNEIDAMLERVEIPQDEGSNGDRDSEMNIADNMSRTSSREQEK